MKVPPITSSIKNVSLPAARVTSLAREVKPHKEEEYLWLHKARQVLDDNDGEEDNISWATLPAISHQKLNSSVSPHCF